MTGQPHSSQQHSPELRRSNSDNKADTSEKRVNIPDLLKSASQDHHETANEGIQVPKLSEGKDTSTLPDTSPPSDAELPPSITIDKFHPASTSRSDASVTLTITFTGITDAGLNTFRNTFSQLASGAGFVTNDVAATQSDENGKNLEPSPDSFREAQESKTPQPNQRVELRKLMERRDLPAPMVRRRLSTRAIGTRRLRAQEYRDRQTEKFQFQVTASPVEENDAEDRSVRGGYAPQWLKTTGLGGTSSPAFMGAGFGKQSSGDFARLHMGSSDHHLRHFEVSPYDIEENSKVLAEVQQLFRKTYGERISDSDDINEKHKEAEERTSELVDDDQKKEHIIFDHVLDYKSNLDEGRYRPPDRQRRIEVANSRLDDFKNYHANSRIDDDRYMRKVERLLSLYDSDKIKRHNVFQIFISDRWSRRRIKKYITEEYNAYVERYAYIKAKYSDRPVSRRLPWNWWRKHRLKKHARLMVEVRTKVKFDELDLGRKLFELRLKTLERNVSQMSHQEFKRFNDDMQRDVDFFLVERSHDKRAAYMDNMSQRGQQRNDLLFTNQYATWTTGVASVLMTVMSAASHGVL